MSRPFEKALEKSVRRQKKEKKMKMTEREKLAVLFERFSSFFDISYYYTHMYVPTYVHMYILIASRYVYTVRTVIIYVPGVSRVSF